MWLVEIYDFILYNHQHGISRNKTLQDISEAESLLGSNVFVRASLKMLTAS